MSLSQKNLALIQKAGQAVHAASEVLASTVRSQAESMVASVASQPFGAESEQSIARFKVLARLSQGLVGVEAQLQELYAIAGELANPASDVIVLPSLGQRKSATNASAVDVEAKPAAASKPVKAKRKVRTSNALTANDSKLLHYLQGALKGGGARAITGAAMAKGAGLPLGSVGVSLRKVMASGAVQQAGRGTYQLSGTVQAVPSKNARATGARKAARALPKKPKAAPVRKLKAAKAAKATKQVVAAETASAPADAAVTPG
jgi:hypothetical protein